LEATPSAGDAEADVRMADAEKDDFANEEDEEELYH
jgi:hypothetical protein